MADNRGLMLIRHRFGRIPCWWLLEIILALLIMGVWSGCTEKTIPPPPPRAELKPVVDWLGRYYQSSPLGKGWKVSSLASQGERVLIIVAIPPEQASLIMRRPANDQFSIVAEQVCPGRSEAVWQLLPAGSSINVQPSVSGQVFIEVVCGH